MARNLVPSVGSENTQFQKNYLDDFVNTAYHFELYMIADEDFKNRNLQTENRIVIAKTGVSSKINIDDVNIESYPGPGKIQGNSGKTKFTFMLTEALGSSLMDDIIFETGNIGIRNHTKAPFVLSLHFNGYDENGRPVTGLHSFKWFWAIQIRSIETEVSHMGTLYNVTAYAYNDISTSEEYGTIKQTIKLKAEETVGDAINELFLEINRINESNRYSSFSYPDLYNYEIDNSFKSMKMKEVNAKTISNRNSDDEFEDLSVTTINIQRGMSINDAINLIFSQSQEFQRISRNVSDTDDIYSSDTDPSDLKVIPHIETEAHNLEYDLLRGDYVRLHHFKISKFEMPMIVEPSDADVDSEKLARNIQSRGFLRKRYDFLYTGLNDQVLEFNLKFNMSWYIPIPFIGGVDQNMSGRSESRQRNIVDRDESMKEYRQSITKLTAMSGDDLSSEKARLQVKIKGDPRLSDEEKSSLINLISGKRSPSSAPTGIVIPPSFIESRKALPSKGKGDYDHGSENTNGTGRKFVTGLFNRAFSGITGDMVSIDLVIKGDPYWLGDADLDTIDDGIDYTRGMHSVLVRVKEPVEHSSETGTINVDRPSFSGVYFARKITHTFQNGMFTQTISGARETRITDVNHIKGVDS